MIIRRLEDIEGTARAVTGDGWHSYRLLVKADGLGFSLHDTFVHAGTTLQLWYKHHLEACYCLEGEGSVEKLADGEIYELRPGTLYALDQNDQHIVRAKTALRLICVFNPPLSGHERHDADGSYELSPTDSAD
ncbi:MAG TPA: ectoine synthase [Anaerolineae bacterium]|nr:ectoine synthase [Anaerolineae bacterium]HMR64939.1 ectoine synthase [Anaerolineae bacterium]